RDAEERPRRARDLLRRRRIEVREDDERVRRLDEERGVDAGRAAGDAEVRAAMKNPAGPFRWQELVAGERAREAEQIVRGRVAAARGAAAAGHLELSALADAGGAVRHVLVDRERVGVLHPRRLEDVLA